MCPVAVCVGVANWTSDKHAQQPIRSQPAATYETCCNRLTESWRFSPRQTQILIHSSVIQACWSHTHTYIHSQTIAGVPLKTGTLQRSTPPVHFAEYTSRAHPVFCCHGFIQIFFFSPSYCFIFMHISVHTMCSYSKVLRDKARLWEISGWRGWQGLNIVQYVACCQIMKCVGLNK